MGAQTIVAGLSNNLGRDVRLLMDHAGIRRFAEPFKAMRAACVKGWAELGLPIATYAAWTGHDPSVSVAHYTMPGEREAAKVTGRS